MSDRMEDIVVSVEEAINGHLDQFIRWARVEWRMDDRARNDPVFSDQSDEWFAGYNAAIEALPDALRCWLESDQ